MERVIVALLAVAIIGIGWIGGEQHKENCVDAGRTSCSVLPWDNGDQKPKAKITNRECKLLREVSAHLPAECD